MKLALLILLSNFVLVLAIYNHRPGERYQTMLPNLTPEQLAHVKPLIYDQQRTKGQILEDVKRWVHSQSPNTQYHFIRSLLAYKQKDEARNRALDAIEKQVSAEARQFNQNIRRVYDNMEITDRQTCETVSSAIRNTTPEIRQELNITPMDCARVFSTLLQ